MSFDKKPAPKDKGPGSAALVGSTNSLAAARAYLTKKKGKAFTDIRVALSEDNLRESLPHVPSGCDVVDFLIGGEKNSFGTSPCPGIPRGRVTQVWGHESAGKTTLALTTAAKVCAAGGSVLYIDWENDIVPDYAQALGVPITDPDRFELLQPETLEDGIKFAMTYAAAGVDLIVFDSVGAAMPRRLATRDALDTAEQGKVGELQSVWSQELPNLKRIIAKTGTAVIGISQIRSNMNTGPGAKTSPQGGNAWKFYSSVRLELRRITNEKAKEHNALTHQVDERVVGGVILVTAIKCKMSRSQGRKELFYIRWGEGIDNVRTILEIATAHGIIKKGGSWFSWAGPKGQVKVQSKEKLRSHLIENVEDYAALRASVIPLLGQGASVEAFTDETEDEDPEGDAIGKVLGAAFDDGEAEDPADKTDLSEDEYAE